jgi:hypothetical protein
VVAPDRLLTLVLAQAFSFPLAEHRDNLDLSMAHRAPR